MKKPGSGNFTGNNRRYAVNQEFFETFTPESAYVAGFIVADGHVGYQRFDITIQEQDIDILESIRSAMQSTHPIHIYHKSGYKDWIAVSLAINSKRIVDDLSSIWGITSPKKNICYPNIPEELDSHFVRGVFDGDGWLTKKDRYNRELGICGCDPLIHQIGERIASHLDLSVKQPRLHGNTLELTYYVSKMSPLVLWLYQGATLSLSRKREKAEAFILRD